MMYAAEQAADVDGAGRGMDEDLIPFLRSEHDVSTALREFPYYRYADPEDNPQLREWLDAYGCDDVWTLPDHLRESDTYRTDVVAVRPDRRALDRRRRAAGVETLISREGWGQPQPRLRTFLNFKRDGPMTREYYIRDHGLHGEPNGMDPEMSERTVQWLTANGFLTEHPGGGGLEPADIRLLYGQGGGAAHAVELKRRPREWDTALQQAWRAEVYADFRWVAMSEPTAGRAIDNAGLFRDAGVGLISVSTSGCTVHVEPERVHHTDRHALLSRPHCERWNLNERVMSRLDHGETA